MSDDLTGIHADISEADYHADPVPEGSLSSSGARLLLKSPAHFRHAPKEFKNSYDFGSVVHTLVLGTGCEIVEIEADNWRKKADTEARDEARARNAAPILSKDLVDARAMAAAVHDHPAAAQLLAMPGTSEASIIWHNKVWRRARVDWLPDCEAGSRPVLVDYKTTVDASPEAFAKSAIRYGYHHQGPWYVDGYRAVTGCDLEPAFLIVAQEKEAPYLVSVHQIMPDAMEAGRRGNEKAVARYMKATETGVWPGYPDEIQPLDLPMWAEQHFQTLEGDEQ